MMKNDVLTFTHSQWLLQTRLYGFSLSRGLMYSDYLLDMKRKVNHSTLWSYEIVAPKRGNTPVYRCPDAYVMKHICEEVAKCMLLAFPSCEYHLIKIIHTEVSK